jgi:hypothetical protein
MFHRVASSLQQNMQQQQSQQQQACLICGTFTNQ